MGNTPGAILCIIRAVCPDVDGPRRILVELRLACYGQRGNLRVCPNGNRQQKSLYPRTYSE